MNTFHKMCSVVVLLLFSSLQSYAQPNANFTATKTEGCAPFAAQFTSSEQGSGFTHDWDFGNGTINNGPANPSRTYTSVGTYTVKHTITGSNGTRTETKTNYIVVHPAPTADFTASQVSGCPPMSVNFTDASTPNVGSITAWEWVYGAATPTSSTAKNPTNVVYSTPGSFPVTLKVTNSKGCVHTVTKQNYIKVLDLPVVNFSSDKTEFCSAPGTANFTSTVTGNAPTPYSYAWTLPAASNVQNPSATYTGPAPAQYSVGLTVTAANGCATTINKPNFIKMYNVVSAFNAPAFGCPGEPVQFTNASTAGSVFTWNFGDFTGTTSTKDPTHTFANPGTYTVTLKAAIGSCDNSSSKTITIRNRPTLTIQHSPKDPCPAPQTIAFSTTSTMSSYNWTFFNSDNPPSIIGTSTSATPSQAYTKNSNGRYYGVKLDIIDGFGCSNSVNYAFNIDTLWTEIKAESPDPPCVPYNIKFSAQAFTYNDPFKAIVAYPHAIKSYKWLFGDGNSSTLAAPSHTYLDSGQFRVIVEIETMNGCITRDTMYIEAGYKPKINDFTASMRRICPKTEVGFKANVTGYKPLTYTWYYGDGFDKFVDIDTASHLYKCGIENDTFDVKLVAAHYGCYDTLNKPKYVEVMGPCADFSYIKNCPNTLSIKFVDNSAQKTSRDWDFGDGQTSTAEKPDHVYATGGKYKVRMIAFNSSTGCRDTMIKEVQVGSNPVVLTADKTKICAGGSVNFRARNTNYEWSPFSWKRDNWQTVTFPDTGEYVTEKFPNPGVYEVHAIRLRNNAECQDTQTIKITVGPSSVGFVADVTKQCRDMHVEFTDTSKVVPGTTIVSRNWHFGTTGDTITTYTAKYKKAFASTGVFNVRLIITDNIGCKDTVTTTQYVEIKRPKAAFFFTKACAGAPISVGNTSGNAVAYEWDFGDGNTSTDQSPGHVFQNRGNYNVRLVAIDDLGCRDTVTRNRDVTRPTANFTITDSIAVCPPLITTFNASPSPNAKSILWHFDDGSSPSSQSTQSIVYQNIKDYKPMLVATDTNGCNDTMVKSVQVLGYSGAITYATKSGCVPLTVTFTNIVTGIVPTMVWDFGDGNTQTATTQQQTITYTYTKPGRYIPRLIFNNNQGCVVSSDGLDTIIVDDIYPEFETGPLCEYTNVEFFDKSVSEASSVSKRFWTFHNGTSADTDPKNKYGAAGKYMVKLVATNTRGCTDSIEKEVTINSPINVEVLTDTVICLTDTIQLFPNGGVSYEWSPPGAISCLSCNNPFVYPKVKTTYKVISTDINGCHDTATLQIGIKTHVVSTVGPGGEICMDEDIVLSIDGGRTYAWTPSGSLDNASSSRPKAKPKETTRYMVVAYEGRCIPDTNHVLITVHPKPRVTVKGEQTIVAGNSADLIASGTEITRFAWEPSGTLSCATCSDPVARPYKTTTYTVKVFTKFDCVDSASLTITVLCDKSQVYIPNTFTPNGDGMNDVFMVRGTGISTIKSFRIYNRWGSVVFEKTNINVNDAANGWDGTYSGAQLPPDVYIYTVEAYCDNGDLMDFKGDVTIIR